MQKSSLILVCLGAAMFNACAPTHPSYAPNFSYPGHSSYQDHRQAYAIINTAQGDANNQAQDATGGLGFGYSLGSGWEHSISGGIYSYKTLPVYSNTGIYVQSGLSHAKESLLNPFFGLIPGLSKIPYQFTFNFSGSMSYLPDQMGILGAGVYFHGQTNNSWFNLGQGTLLQLNAPIFAASQKLSSLVYPECKPYEFCTLTPRSTLWIQGSGTLELPFGDRHHGLILNLELRPGLAIPLKNEVQEFPDQDGPELTFESALYAQYLF